MRGARFQWAVFTQPHGPVQFVRVHAVAVVQNVNEAGRSGPEKPEMNGFSPGSNAIVDEIGQRGGCGVAQTTQGFQHHTGFRWGVSGFGHVG